MSCVPGGPTTEPSTSGRASSGTQPVPPKNEQYTCTPAAAHTATNRSRNSLQSCQRAPASPPPALTTPPQHASTRQYYNERLRYPPANNGTSCSPQPTSPWAPPNGCAVNTIR